MKALIRTQAIAQGRRMEREQLVATLKNRICFERKIGKCSHAICAELWDIINQLEAQLEAK